MQRIKQCIAIYAIHSQFWCAGHGQNVATQPDSKPLWLYGLIVPRFGALAARTLQVRSSWSPETFHLEGTNSTDFGIVETMPNRGDA